jgi:serine-type D-Ala-D-Ala carboxypeptidase/endopeptidase (penicillin-binding protein 4)
MRNPGAGAVVLSVAAALTLTACSARAADPATAVQRPDTRQVVDTKTTPAARLTADLQSLFTAPELSHAHLAVLVRSLLTGDTLFALNERHMMVPASNQKLLTMAAAARVLGWDYRYTTRVIATGTLKPDGTLDGNLIVAGSGDPTINPRHPERWRALDDWAGQIAARGVRVINGHLIGDDNAFAEPGWGSGWSWDDLVADYGSPIGALQYHENEVELLVGPGMTAGVPAIVSSAPLGHGLLVDNQVTTVAAGQPTRVTVDRVPGTIFLSLRGQISAGARPVHRVVAVDNPTTLFVNAFREALSRKGIFVGGSAIDIDELPVAQRPGQEGRNSSPVDSGGEVLVTDYSPPLYEIVDPLQKWSRNGYAETLLWTMSPAGAPASEAAGLSVMQTALTDLGVDPSLYRAFDGSGLSRYDMVSPEALVRMLTAVWNDPAMVGPFRASLPVAGVSGSLADQMGGTPAEGRVWAKTGSMFNIRSLSGYVLTADNEPLAISFLANNYTVPSAQIEALYDAALVKLAAFRQP